MFWLDTSDSIYFDTCYFILASMKAAIFIIRAAAFYSIIVASQSLHRSVIMATVSCGIIMLLFPILPLVHGVCAAT